MSCVHFIGGEKGGVGKSVTARVLAQFHIDRNLPFTAFDSDRSHGALMRFYQDYSHPLIMDAFESADQMIETSAQTGCHIIVDLAAQTAAALHQWIEQSGVTELAEDLGLNLIYWHVMDDGRDSLDLLHGLIDDYADAVKYVLVRNRGRGRDFSAFDQSPAKRKAESAGAVVMDLAELHAPTMKKIDHSGSSFWAAANAKEQQSLGLLERQRVRVWLKKTYGEFDRMPFFRAADPGGDAGLPPQPPVANQS